MKPEDHQIIKQMADRLREHSVPYKEGAWERFKELEKKKSRNLVLWPYFSAAAAILIAVILFSKPEQQIPVTNEIVKQNITRGGGGVHEEGKTAIDEDRKPIAKRIDKDVGFQTSGIRRDVEIAVISKSAVEKEGLTEGFQNSLEPVSVHQEQMTSFQSEEIGVGENTLIEKGITEPALVSTVKKEEKKGPTDFLSALLTIKEDSDFVDHNDIDKKWSFGLDISPNISSNKQVNMGGGVALAYSVSPKVSFSSGVSYLQLDAERMIRASSQMGSPNSTSGGLNLQEGVYLGSGTRVKTLNKTASNLIGLDIPLNINYHVSKNLFASAGISVFNVFNEERIDQYENQEVEVFYSGSDNRTPEPMIRTFYSSEVAREKQYQGKGLSGFYNFSVGYSIPVSKKVGLSFEPFFKIPMNTLRDKDMNLSNGGIKISTKF